MFQIHFTLVLALLKDRRIKAILLIYPYRGMNVKFQAFSERIEFHGVSPKIRVSRGLSQ